MAFTVQHFFKRFPDDNTCLNHLMNTRYGESLDCPKCGKHGKFSQLSKMPAFACAWCGHHIHPMAGTPFQASQRMGHEIRKYMGKVDGDDSLNGHVEIDETVVGGHRKGGKRGRIAPGKTIVLGMLQRGGSVMTKVVPNVRKATLEPHILENVGQSSTVSTDELPSYNRLGKLGYQHGTVNHSDEEWVRGIHHTNSIEGFWSQLKRSISGTHIHVSGKHLSKYLVEFEYRFNLRHAPEQMFPRLMASF